MALFESTFPPYVAFGSRTLSLRTPRQTGTDVAVLQAVYNLMLTAMNPPLGPMGAPISVTGTFDSATQHAVRNIQSYFGLAADGVAGTNTFFVYGQGVGPNTTYGGPVYGSRQLLLGSTGGDVTVLQNRLNCFRYATLIGHPANGVFDAGTRAAVLAFQADAIANGDTGIALDGIVGPNTFDASWLYTFAGGRGIFTGRNGFDVVFVQTILAQLGFYSGRITGYYDSLTVAAVRAFQANRGITVDGVVGQQTFFQMGRSNQVAAPLPLGIAWPASISVGVSTCCVGLVTQTSDLHPYGMAAIVTNEAEGFESLDVVGNMLPSPRSFGTAFAQYAFTLTTGSGVVARGLMDRLPDSVISPSDWGGSYSPGVVSIPKGVVTIYPTHRGSRTGPYGPAVLSGDLTNCT